MRGFEGGQEGAGFVDAFLMLAFGGGIGDDSASGLHVGDTIFDDHSSQRDAGVQITSKIHVQHAAGIDAAAGAFEFFDNFHGADLGRAGGGAGGEDNPPRVHANPNFSATDAHGGGGGHHPR